MFLNFTILVTSFLVGIFILIKLVNNFYDKNLTNQKITIETRIRWGDSKKSHLGGLSFLVSLLSTNIIIFIFFREFFLEHYNDFILFSSIIILSGFFGFLDEKYSYKPFEKIMLQLIIAVLLVVNDKIIHFSHNEAINISVSIFYYLAIFNILNMFDNIDLGLSSIAIPMIVFFMLFDTNQANFIILLTFFGSLIAFSYFNFFPSKIFMGDIGSFQIATMLAAISVEAFWTDFEYNGYISSLFQLGLHNFIFLLPIADFVIVSIIRFSDGKSIFTGDTKHISHVFNLKLKNANYLGLLFLIVTTGLGIIYFYYYKGIVSGQYNLLNLIIMYFIFISLTYYLYKSVKND